MGWEDQPLLLHLWWQRGKRNDRLWQDEGMSEEFWFHAWVCQGPRPCPDVSTQKADPLLFHPWIVQACHSTEVLPRYCDPTLPYWSCKLSRVVVARDRLAWVFLLAQATCGLYHRARPPPASLSRLPSPPLLSAALGCWGPRFRASRLCLSTSPHNTIPSPTTFLSLWPHRSLV